MKTYFCLFLIQIVTTLTKDLHIKEDFNKKRGVIGIDFKDAYNYNEIITNNERIARHLEAVTESVIEHLIKELKRLRPNMDPKNTSRFVRKLQTKLNKRRQKKRNRKITIRKEKKA